ncbi:unnamed protein product [Closterium sp. NIES-64]|nr:unnamed protein product [Closterium sp. NIES-64]
MRELPRSFAHHHADYQIHVDASALNPPNVSTGLPCPSVTYFRHPVPRGPPRLLASDVSPSLAYAHHPAAFVTRAASAAPLAICALLSTSFRRASVTLAATAASLSSLSFLLASANFAGSAASLSLSVPSFPPLSGLALPPVLPLLPPLTAPSFPPLSAAPLLCELCCFCHHPFFLCLPASLCNLCCFCRLPLSLRPPFFLFPESLCDPCCCFGLPFFLFILTLQPVLFLPPPSLSAPSLPPPLFSDLLRLMLLLRHPYPPASATRAASTAAFSLCVSSSSSLLYATLSSRYSFSSSAALADPALSKVCFIPATCSSGTESTAAPSL